MSTDTKQTSVTVYEDPRAAAAVTAEYLRKSRHYARLASETVGAVKCNDLSWATMRVGIDDVREHLSDAQLVLSEVIGAALELAKRERP